MDAPARIALADDDVLLREGLASLLERSGFEIVGQAGDAPELLALVRGRQPELVIVDIRMPPDHSIEGLEAAQVIRDEFPDVGLLLLYDGGEDAGAPQPGSCDHRGVERCDRDRVLRAAWLRRNTWACRT
jgi:DNA-binding NarL/FixJ family response regulator